jgi:hypothetical protein
LRARRWQAAEKCAFREERTANPRMAQMARIFVPAWKNNP